jgi:hypothetical protein
LDTRFDGYRAVYGLIILKCGTEKIGSYQNGSIMKKNNPKYFAQVSGKSL